LAHLALFFYGMALLIVGGGFFAKIIRETTEIKAFFSSLIKFSMKLGSLYYCVYSLALFVPTPTLCCSSAAINKSCLICLFSKKASLFIKVGL
jgi:hypothetical protein